MKLLANAQSKVIGCLILLVWGSVWAAGCSSARPSRGGGAAYSLDQGAIAGAKFAIAVPGDWSGDLLIIAHGFRPPKAPLIADLDPSDPFVAELLSRGWLVATTSYRRNGLVIADAQEDIERLIGAIVRKYGACQTILIEGSSMGANIALLMAEQASLPDPRVRLAYAISGVIALGGAPEAAGETGSLAWTRAPHLPLLFVSNRSELAPVQEYAGQVRRDRYHPAVWVLDRDGHVNINAPERLAAIRAMARWANGGPRPSGTATTPYDATVDLSARESVATATKYKPRKPHAEMGPIPGRRGRILAVDPFYGNVTTNLVAADLAVLGIQPGDRLRVICGEVKRQATLGTSYADVAEGDLVVFLTAEGNLQVAVNLGNAARRLKCHPDEPLEITPWFDRSNGIRYY